MKKMTFLQADFWLAALSAALIYHYGISECFHWMSFAGFGALLELLFLAPGFLALLAEGVLLLLALRGHQKCAAAAYLLQIISGIPSTLFLLYAPEIFWPFAAYTVLLALGLIGLTTRRFTP